METRNPSEEELAKIHSETSKRLWEAHEKLREFAIHSKTNKIEVCSNYIQARLDELLADYALKVVKFNRLDEEALRKAPESEREQMKIESELRREGREKLMNQEKTMLERTLGELKGNFVNRDLDYEIQVLWRNYNDQKLAAERKARYTNEAAFLSDDDDIKVISLEKPEPIASPKETKAATPQQPPSPRNQSDWGARPSETKRHDITLGDRTGNNAPPKKQTTMPFREHRRPVVEHNYAKDIQALQDIIQAYTPPKKGILFYKRKPAEDNRITEIKKALNAGNEKEGLAKAKELISQYVEAINKSTKAKPADKLISDLQNQINKLEEKPEYRG